MKKAIYSLQNQILKDVSPYLHSANKVLHTTFTFKCSENQSLYDLHTLHSQRRTTETLQWNLHLIKTMQDANYSLNISVIGLIEGYLLTTSRR